MNDININNKTYLPFFPLESWHNDVLTRHKARSGLCFASSTKLGSHVTLEFSAYVRFSKYTFRTATFSYSHHFCSFLSFYSGEITRRRDVYVRGTKLYQTQLMLRGGESTTLIDTQIEPVPRWPLYVQFHILHPVLVYYVGRILPITLHNIRKHMDNK